jgi:hypothetical protein
MEDVGKIIETSHNVSSSLSTGQAYPGLKIVVSTEAVSTKLVDMDVQGL